MTRYEKAWPIIRCALGLPEDHPDGSDILPRIAELKAAASANYNPGMRWFGENWGAPVCATTEQAPTPLGVLCAHGCGHSIRPGDQGLLIPTWYVLSDSKYTMIDGIPHVAYHLVCFFDNIGVRGVTHN